MEMMILSILVPALECEWELDELQSALVSTIVFCGMMISAPIWGKLSDFYGRKVCIILSALFLFYFGVLSVAAPTLIWLLVLRGLVGFGIGAIPQNLVLYAEFLPSKLRAKCLTINGVFWSVGTCFEVLLAIAIMPTLGWRWLLAFSSLPLLLFLSLGCVWLPESVRFHMTSGKSDLAFETLLKLANENGTAMPVGGLAAVDNKIKERGQFKDLLSKEHRCTSLILWFIFFSLGFSFYGIVLLTTEMFQMGNACKATEAIQSQHGEAYCTYKSCLDTQDYIDLLYTTVAEFVGIFVTVLIIDLIGRKKTMAFNFIMFSLFVFLLNVCVSRSWLIVFFFIARCFIKGAFKTIYVYTPEYYPTVVYKLII